MSGNDFVNGFKTSNPNQYKRLKESINRGKREFRKKGGIEGRDFVVCQICESILYDSLANNHIQRTHGMTVEAYRNSYPNAFIYPESKSKRVKGDKNPGYQHGGTLSPWSEKSNHSPEARASAKAKAIDGRVSPLKVEYWTARGHAADEAMEIISKSQNRFSLVGCIEKYGEKGGTKIWEARQEKWLKTMNAKSPEEKIIINKKKVYMFGPDSKIERKLFEELKKHVPELNKHHTIFRKDDPTRSYIYDMIFGNKLIEFHGDFWHGNPKKYLPEQKIVKQITVKDMWAKDAHKLLTANEAGFKLLVVWEHEYKETPQLVIDKCLNFLNS